jgi:hypothetical protein
VFRFATPVVRQEPSAEHPEPRTWSLRSGTVRNRQVFRRMASGSPRSTAQAVFDRPVAQDLAWAGWEQNRRSRLQTRATQLALRRNHRTSGRAPLRRRIASTPPRQTRPPLRRNHRTFGQASEWPRTSHILTRQVTEQQQVRQSKRTLHRDARRDCSVHVPSRTHSGDAAQSPPLPPPELNRPSILPA